MNNMSPEVILRSYFSILCIWQDQHDSRASFWTGTACKVTHERVLKFCMVIYIRKTCKFR